MPRDIFPDDVRIIRDNTRPITVYLPNEILDSLTECIRLRRAADPDARITRNSMVRHFVRAGLAMELEAASTAAKLDAFRSLDTAGQEAALAASQAAIDAYYAAHPDKRSK